MMPRDKTNVLSGADEVTVQAWSSAYDVALQAILGHCYYAGLRKEEVDKSEGLAAAYADRKLGLMAARGWRGPHIHSGDF